MNEFNVTGYDLKFRIANMSGIEILALKSIIKFDDVDKMMVAINEILKRTEVCIDGIWLRCKDKDVDAYYPDGLEQNPIAVNEIVETFLTYLLSVFQKSIE